MLINLSDVLSEHHKTIDKTTSVEMTEFHSELGRFPVLEKEDVHIVVKHVKNRELMITGEGRLGEICVRQPTQVSMRQQSLR